ncbi:GumC family protein [Granulosicoccus sp. 3-233]|uniref:GumC family protein n=1 Tax=Granulosicoccus sp. 3-233 TaxID=3417969 RepID=UPI003D33CE9E
MNTVDWTRDQENLYQGAGKERGTPAEGPLFGIDDYIRIVKQSKWKLLLVFLIAAVLSGLYVRSLDSVYLGTATLLFEEPDRASLSQFEGALQQELSTAYYETQIELLRSRWLSRKVIDTLSLWKHPELRSASTESTGVAEESDRLVDRLKARAIGILGQLRAAIWGAFPGLVSEGDADDSSITSEDGPAAGMSAAARRQHEEDRVINRFMANVSVYSVRDTRLVRIEYRSAEPQLAAQVANSIARQYINNYASMRSEQRAQNTSWLDERLLALKETLADSERRLIDYKKENSLTDIGGSVHNLIEQEVLRLSSELTDVRGKLAIAQQNFDDVNDYRTQSNILESLPGIRDDTLVQRNKLDVNASQRKLDELLNRYGVRHPLVIDASSELASRTAAFKDSIATAIGAMEKNYLLLVQQEASLELKLQDSKRAILDSASKANDVQALEREVRTNREIYQSFFNRVSRERSSGELQQRNARVSDYAVVPLEAIAPNRKLIVALFCAGSVLLYLMILFWREFRDDSVKTTYDVENKLGMVLLGITPLMKAGKFRKKKEDPLDPLSLEDSRRTFTEAVNSVRASIGLDKANTSSSKKVVMVTSSVAGEGKSTVSLNLAYSYGQIEKVLLIDCDMRKPRIAKSVGLKNNANGLSNLILDTEPAWSCIHRGMLNGCVDVLPSGPIPVQPLELLGSKRFANILTGLARRYDRIIIDCAPIQAVADALMLCPLSDTVVYAVKYNDTSSEHVKRGIQRLRSAGARVAGVLLTQVDVDKVKAYGGNSYHQGYFDYYDSSEVQESSPPHGQFELTPERLAAINSPKAGLEIELDRQQKRVKPGEYQIENLLEDIL